VESSSTHREVTAQRPDIIIKNKRENMHNHRCGNRNVMQKEREKKLNYKILCTGIQRTWNLKCKIIAVIIGATKY
jgi:hypothetical protein